MTRQATDPCRSRAQWGALFLALALALAGGPATTAALSDAPDEDFSHLLKLSPALLSEGESFKAGEPTQARGMIVRYNRPPGDADVTKVEELSGSVSAMLNDVEGISVTMAVSDAIELAKDPGVEFITADASVISMLDISSKTISPGRVPRWVNDLTGSGVTVAVLDSGIAFHPDLAGRVVASVDIVTQMAESRSSGSLLDLSGETTSSFALEGETTTPLFDPYGHGTHVAGIVAGDGSQSKGLYRGIAPGADLVSVRVLDEQGAGTTSGVIAGLEWVVKNKDLHGIRVVVMSLGHPVFEPAPLDPLVRAVDRAWEAGLVVVCSAGNRGQDVHYTISSPGNSRRVITIGSMTDWNTVSRQDDLVSSYSSRGPALYDPISPVAKPDLLAPGNRIVSLRSAGSKLDVTFPDWQVTYKNSPGAAYFELSGTSMATPIVAGTAALMLEHDPTLGPDTVKARLMRGADTSVDGSPYSRGAGLVDLVGALEQTGLSDNALSPRLYRGDSEGEIIVEDTGELWGNSILWADSILWGESILWADSVLWADGILWSDSILWADGILWSDSILWADTIPMPE